MAISRGYYLQKMANNTIYFFVRLKSVNPITKSTYGDIRNTQNLYDIRYVLRRGLIALLGLTGLQERINNYFTIY